jgi:Zn-finger nucleic acid-binding protein
MKCPACFNVLTPQQVGGVTVDICEGGCGGVWLDAFELQRLEGEEESKTEYLLQIARDPTLKVDMTRKRECPRCIGVKLKRRFFSPRRQVEIDECPGCGGVWLDAGELEGIRKEMEQAQEGRVRPTQLTMTMIRQIYRFRLEQQRDL